MRFAISLLTGLVSLSGIVAEPILFNGTPPPHDVPMRSFGDDRYRFSGHFLNTAMSPDGKRFAILSNSQQRRHAIVTIFDANTGKPLVISRVPYSEIGFGAFILPGFEFSNDGRRIAVRLNPATAFAISTETGQELWRLKNEPHSGYSFCAFDADGRILLTNEKETHVYAIPSGDLVAAIPVGNIAKVALDGKTYVRTKKVYAEVEVGDLLTGKPRYVLPLRTAHNGSENGYAMSHDGKTLAVVHSISEIHLIDLATGATKRSWAIPKGTLPESNPEFAMAFSADDRSLGFSAQGVMHVWELEPFQLRLTKHHSMGVYHRAWLLSSGGHTLLLPSTGELELWDVTKNTNVPDAEIRGGSAIALTPEGSQLLVGDRFGSIGIWDAKTGEFVRTLVPRPTKEKAVSTLAISPDGRSLAFYRYDADFEVVALNSDSRTQKATVAGASSRMLCWSPDSRFVYGHRTDLLSERVKFVAFDIQKKLVVQTFDVRNPMTISPDGKEFLDLDSNPNQSGFPFQAKLVHHDIAKNVRTNRTQLDLQTSLKVSPGPLMLRYSPDGSRLAVVSRRHIGFLPSLFPPFLPTDAATPTSIFATPGKAINELNSIDFSPSGHWLVTGGEDCSVKVWEVATGKLVRRFDRHDLGVTQVVVAPDGRSVFSAGHDGFVCQWDLLPNHANLPIPPDELLAATRSPDASLGTAAAWRLIGDAKLREFATQKLLPIAKPDVAKVKRWLDDLDAPAFADRREAKRQLELQSRNIEAELRERLSKTESVETRERIEELIARFDKKLSPEEVAAMRLVQACEWHRQTEPLTMWASGAASAVLTREALSALARMGTR